MLGYTSNNNILSSKVNAVAATLFIWCVLSYFCFCTCYHFILEPVRENLVDIGLPRYPLIINVKCSQLNKETVHFSEECTICLQAHELDDILSVTECKHVYHQECLAQWINRRHDKCPICSFNLITNTYPAIAV